VAVTIVSWLHWSTTVAAAGMTRIRPAAAMPGNRWAPLDFGPDDPDPARVANAHRWTVLLLALCAAGCGGARAAPPVASPGTMRFVAAAPPAPATPGRGPVNLVFVTPRRGFVATAGGLRDVARVGWVLPSAPGEIERSRDGGATWRSLWRGRLSFDALAVRRRLIVASGMRARETGRHDAWFTTFRRHTLLVSRDGGRTWGRRSLPIRGTVALQILAPRLWLAFRAHEPFGESGSALLRSDDAGRHWYRVPVPRGTQALRFATPLVAVASADARSCRGRQRDEFGFRMQLWRTTDGGWTWRPLAGTCAPSNSVADFDFVAPHLAFAVQGNEDSLQRFGVLRRSTDGGATWTTVARDRRHTPFRVHFSDRRHGTLVEEAGRPSRQRVLILLATTTDGGRTWTRHGLPAEAVDGLPAMAGRDVWVGHARSGVVWHTNDGGRRWTLTAAPRSLDPGSDSYFPDLLAGRGVLVVSSGAGPVESRDGGRTWSPVRWPSARDAALLAGRGAYVVYGDRQDQVRLLTPAGSQPVRLPAGVRHVTQAAFANASDGLIVGQRNIDRETPYATHDGGRTWTPVAHPVRRPVSGFSLAPGLIVDSAGRALSVTTDDGASWQTAGRIPVDEECEASRPSPPDIWIACIGFGRERILFTSGDGGRTWTRRVTNRSLDVWLSGTGGSEAWATTTAPAPGGDERSSLWHTTDGGATWNQVWAALPPRAPAREIDCAIVPSGVWHVPLPGCR
jgi:photosystem II stability/assembly factor-like uncharacterized protein